MEVDAMVRAMVEAEVPLSDAGVGVSVLTFCEGGAAHVFWRARCGGSAPTPPEAGASQGLRRGFAGASQGLRRGCAGAAPLGAGEPAPHPGPPTRTHGPRTRGKRLTPRGPRSGRAGPGVPSGA